MRQQEGFLSTDGMDRSSTAKKIFPDDLSGKSVLHIGCKLGYFCFEAAKRGANRVVGVDIDPDSIRKARLLAESLDVDVSFELFDVEVHPIDATFDYVLCLNVLHHWKNPIATLDKLISITRERLVLEVAMLDRDNRRKAKVSRIANFFLSRYPIIFVSKNGTPGKQKFFITSAAIENLLFHQRRMFAHIDTFPSERKYRYISVAHRRTIDEVIVVNGPSASGKSLLIKKLERGEVPEVARRVGIINPADWVTGGTKELKGMTQPILRQLIFHYDFLRPYLTSTKIHERDEALDILDIAQKVTFLTIWCPPHVLRRQFEQRELAYRETLGVEWRSQRHRKLNDEYKDPATIVALYRRWFEYTRTRPGDHVIVSLTDRVQFYSMQEWESLAQKYEGETSNLTDSRLC